MFLLGVFFVSFALFSFEIASASVISSTFGSHQVFAVLGIAMLGITAAGTHMSFAKREMSSTVVSRYLFILSMVMSICFLLCFALLTGITDEINSYVRNPPEDIKQMGVVWRHIWGSQKYAALIGLVTLVPYMAFGYLISLLLLSRSDREIGRIYFFDLFGGALGCLASYLTFEYLDYRESILLPMFTGILGAMCFLWKRPLALALTGVAVGTGIAGVIIVNTNGNWFEPRPQIDLQTRNYDLKKNPEEVWRDWNSYSRIGLVRSNAGNENSWHRFMLGNGEGQVSFWRYNSDPNVPIPAGTAAHLAFDFGTKPKDALVLFAGVGADMIDLDKLAQGETNITGVEINRQMVEGAVSADGFHLDEFLGRDHINLVVDEARSFLERDKKQYDFILLSWSGATTAYLTGAIGHTSQYVYTKEAFEAIFRRLKPGGHVAVLNANKFRLISTIQQVLKSRSGWTGEDSFIVTGEGRVWMDAWDPNVLIVKPDGFSRAEIAAFAKKGNSNRVLYAPYWENSTVNVYTSLITGINRGELEMKLKAAAVNLSPTTDNKPYVFFTETWSVFLSPEFWAMVFKEEIKSPEAAQIYWTGLIGIAAFLLVVLPLTIKGGVSFSSQNVGHLAYFSALGFGFMFIEIGLIAKLGLLLGPGLTIAVVLGGLVLFAGLGSMISNQMFESLLSFKSTTLLLIIYMTSFILLGDELIKSALTMPRVARVLVALATILPPGVLMGHLFPQGLRLAGAYNRGLIPWAWGINGAFGTIATGLAPTISMFLGYQTVIAIGLAWYGVILILPGYNRAVRQSLVRSKHEPDIPQLEVTPLVLESP